MNFYIMYAINILSDSCRLPHTGSSADERWGVEAGANYRGPAVRNGARGPIVVHIYLSRQYHYLSNAQINPFRPSPTYSATENQYFRFSVNIFSRFALAGGARKKFFSPNPLSAALIRGFKGFKLISGFQNQYFYYIIKTRDSVLLGYDAAS